MTIRLTPGKVLRPRIELPVAAAENLAESIAFEMDRHTPFVADEVFFDFEVVGTDPEMQRLQIDMEVARKTDVFAAVDTARGMGLAAERVTGPDEIDASRRSLNLLPQDRRARRGKILPRATAAAALIAALLSLAALYTWIDRKEALLARTEDRLADLRARAGEAAHQQERLDRLLALSRHVSDERRRRPLVVEIIDDISRRLPDGHWLISLSLRDTTLQLSGLSEDPSELLRLLERSELLREARFAAPVTSDPATGKGSFTVLAELVREGGGE